MRPIKDRRIANRKVLSAQGHGNDLVNGVSIAHSLPFVAAKEPGYHDVMSATTDFNLAPDQIDTGGYGGGGSGADQYLTPSTEPAPSPAPSIPAVNPTPEPSLPPPYTLPVTTPPVETTLPAPISPAPAPFTSPVETPVDIPSDTAPAAQAPVLAGPSTTPVTQPASASPQPPVAFAGTDQVISGTMATLDASGSSDPQDSQLSFLWTVTAGPNTPLISSSTSKTAIVSGLVPGAYIFQLTVQNALGMQSTAQTSVTVQSSQPTTAGPSSSSTSATIMTTAPVGGPGAGPFGAGGGGGGGGDGATDNTSLGTPPETFWQKVWHFSKDHWLLLVLVAGATAYLSFGTKDE